MSYIGNFTTLGQWDRSRIAESEETMVNYTPEPQPLAPNPPTPKSRITCGWCMSAHVADIKCTCKEKCPSGWCAVLDPDEEPFRL